MEEPPPAQPALMRRVADPNGSTQFHIEKVQQALKGAALYHHERTVFRRVISETDSALCRAFFRLQHHSRSGGGVVEFVAHIRLQVFSKRLKAVLPLSHQQQLVSRAVCRQFACKESSHCLTALEWSCVAYPVNGLPKIDLKWKCEYWKCHKLALCKIDHAANR